jgi:hypothetical protein
MRVHCIRLDWRHDIGEGRIKELDSMSDLDIVAQIDALADWIDFLTELRDQKLIASRLEHRG